jgi:hypothetical protein
MSHSAESQAGRSLIRAARIGGLFLFLMTGCSGVKPAPPGEYPQAGAAQTRTAAAPPSEGAPATPPKPPAPTAAVAPAERPSALPPPAPAAKSIAKAGAPATQAPAKAAPPASAAQAPKKDIVAQATGTPKAAPLDLTSLETRLKDTEAIGVMTKIALKNQVDDLLDQFRAFYAGKLKTTLAELRRPYDLLVLKVLSLLQDSDPSLAASIAASREAIWGILSDPKKFATI